MYVTARLSYALDALVDLAAADEPVKGDVLAARHGVSVGFLQNILAELRRGGVVHAKRGGGGGYWLARSPDEITIADLIRALDSTSAFGWDAPPGRLLPVWESITRATLDAAEGITLSNIVTAHATEP